MSKTGYVLKSFLHAVAIFAYTAGVAWFLFNAKTIFGDVSSFLAPLLMLLLLIVSATITGLLVLGRPVVLYLNGLKKDAFVFLAYTLSWLLFFLLLVMFFLR